MITFLLLRFTFWKMDKDEHGRFANYGRSFCVSIDFAREAYCYFLRRYNLIRTLYAIVVSKNYRASIST